MHSQEKPAVEILYLPPSARTGDKLPQVVARAIVLVLLDVGAVGSGHMVYAHELPAVLVAYLEDGGCPDLEFRKTPSLCRIRDLAR